MTSRRRKWVALGIAALAIAVLLLGLTGRGQMPTVSVVTATRHPIESWISTNGKIEPIQPFVLRARLDTFVLRVPVTNGQTVHKGQLLVELDGSSAAAKLAQARQNLLAARRQLRYALAGGPPLQRAQLASELAKSQATRDRLAAEHKSLEILVQQHAATPDELAQNQLRLTEAEANLEYDRQQIEDLARQARFDAARARLQIAQAQAETDNLGAQLASTRLLAPVDGTVYALPVKAGDYVHVGDPVVSVADLRHVRLRAYVDEVDLGSVVAGQFVQVQWDGLPGRVWQGRTEIIPKQVVPYQDRRVGEVLCSIDSADRLLLPDTNVDVRIRVARRQNALVIPRTAVLGQGSDRYVFVLKGDRLVRRHVSVGVASVDRFEILSGLQSGDRVALPGATGLKNGIQVHPVEAR
jgi:HlyD family secretion protein